MKRSSSRPRNLEVVLRLRCRTVSALNLQIPGSPLRGAPE